MKKNVFYLLLAVLGFIVLSSCSKNEGEKEIVDYALEIAKTYNGALSIGQGTYTSGQLTITRTATNKIQLKLNGFSYSSYTIGDIIVNDITVVKSDSIRFQVNNKTISATLNEEPWETSISVKGASLNGGLSVRLSIEVFMIPVPVVFDSNILLIGTDPNGSTGEEPFEPTVSFTEIWNAMEGDYNGNLVGMGLQYSSVVNIVKISGEDHRINLTINSVPMIGTITIPNVVVEEVDGVCTFSGATDDNSVTITGKAKDIGEIEFNVSVSAMPFPVTYSGEK